MRAVRQIVQCPEVRVLFTLYPKTFTGISVTRFPRNVILLLAGCGLSACHSDVLHPLGAIAVQQKDLVLASTWLMLIIIVPVMALTIAFAWIYRSSNAKARYEPEWDHSILLELVIWAIPLLIIICLGAMTWLGTHLLDPYRRLSAGERSVPGAAADPVPTPAPVSPFVVEVVALDWKWLFIYPQYHIAAVNELVTPVGREIEFRITASTVMNSFYVPTLAGQIYAMPGMQTTLHAIANGPGESQGFSANYSGAGFSGMHFAYRAVSARDFEAWVIAARSGPTKLTRAAYRELESPSENVAVSHFSTVDPRLFESVVYRCVAADTPCQSSMAMAVGRP